MAPVRTASRPKSSSWSLLAATVLFLAVPLSTLRPGEAERQVAALSEENSGRRELRNQTAFAVILGEFRTDLSDLIFIKTERYLHNGVAYEPHLDMTEMEKGNIQAEKAPGQQAAPAQEEESGHDHSSHAGHDHSSHGAEDLKTVIKSEDDDFRGFVGRLEREVKPWLPPGSPDEHTSGTELLPWYRLATLGNPHNERAYMVAAWWLKSLQTDDQAEEAIRFIDEGIANNPRSFQLHLMRGYVLRQLEREDEALKSFLAAAELVAKVRPPEGKVGPDWSDHLEEQASAAITMAALGTRDSSGFKAGFELLSRLEKEMGSLPGLPARLKSDFSINMQEEAPAAP